MYRDGKIYDQIEKLITDIYLDYNIRSFPMDPKIVCRKLGVALVAYSEFNDSERKLLNKQSRDGFFFGGFGKRAPTIYYNDQVESEGRIHFTIFHELKHYVCEDISDEQDDLADYFAKYFMCPIPYLLLKKIDTPAEIMSICGTSISVAKYVSSNIENRRRKHGYNLFEHEIRLINHLDPVLIEVYHKN